MWAMAFRFRKSVRIAPGIRINLAGKSASVRVGPKGLGYTVSTTGTKRLTASIPGTGIAYSKAYPSKRRLVPSAPPPLGASQTKPSSRSSTALLLLAIGAGVVLFSAPWQEANTSIERSATEGLPKTNLAPATGDPALRNSQSADSDAEPAARNPRTLFSTANVRLRTSPSADSPIVLTVPSGSAVLSSDREGRWHYVSYRNHSGWILGDYLAEPRDETGETSAPIQSAQPSSGSKTISGRATIIDGDTIEIAGTRVRFNGIDAPEGAQLCRDAKGKDYRCGQSAAKALDAWLAKSRPVTCTFIEWDSYGRFVGDCYRSDRAAVAAWLVNTGHALDWPRHSGGAYASLQDEARQAKRGMWQGEFQPAWEWRAAQQLPKVETSRPARLLSGSCHIKGNISNKGIRIYHLPGQRFYEETVISPAKGERMFCSERQERARLRLQSD
jgi:endonuclease YncB( thermonuclease family)